MYCTRCGQQNTEAAQFCVNCGASLVLNSAAPSADPTQAPARKHTFEVSKIFIVLLWVLLALTILGAIGLSVGPHTENPLAKIIVNWLLGFLFGITVLGEIGGVIAGVLLLLKGSEHPTEKDYYNRNAIWCFVGPIVLIVGIIVSYVIINVIANLVKS